MATFAVAGELDRERGRIGRGGEHNLLLERQLREQLVEGAERVDLAVVDDADARAEARRLLHVMRGIDDGEALAVAALEVVEDRVARLWVDADGRLVAEEELRPVEQGGDQVEPALHATGKILHLVPAAIGKLDGLERLVDPLAQVRAAQPIQFAEDAEILFRAEFLLERDGLRDEAECDPGGGIRGRDCDAVERERPRLGCAQAGDERHQRGLAGAIGPEQAEELAAGDVQRNVIQRDEGTIALGDRAKGEHAGVGRDQELTQISKDRKGYRKEDRGLTRAMEKGR